MADCCYSGSLKNVVKKIGGRGTGAVSITSAEASNASTGNWTFTQTIIDCLRGSPLADRNKDGKISIGEIGAEVKDALKYRDMQMSGYFIRNMDGAYTMTKAGSFSGFLKRNSFRWGEYIHAHYRDKWKPARIIYFKKDRVFCEFFSYNKKAINKLPYNKKKINYKTHPVGKKVNVKWGNKTYPAKILKVRDNFHLITYTGWPSYWDEWVLDNRIVEEKKGSVMVEWKGSWYPAVIIKKSGEKYLIHYVGYDSSWDEWVTFERIKFKKE